MTPLCNQYQPGDRRSPLLYHYLIYIFIATGYDVDKIQALGFAGHVNFGGGGEIRICN